MILAAAITIAGVTAEPGTLVSRMEFFLEPTEVLTSPATGILNPEVEPGHAVDPGALSSPPSAISSETSSLATLLRSTAWT